MLRRNARRRTRREVELIIARLLTTDWAVLTRKEQVAARLLARIEGASLAEQAHRSRLAGSDLDEGSRGDRKDYSRSVVRWAHREIGLLEPLDVERWRHMGEEEDPRLVWFRRGFQWRRGELEGE